MVKISASNIRCSVVTETGKVATWFDESISHVCSKLEHPATLYPEFANDKIISLHTCVLYTGTVSQVLTESIPFWAVDSTETHFGQWILQRPILGSGFYKDPFWAVNSFYKDPVWAVDSTPQCGNFMNFLSFRFHVKLILGGSRSAKSALLTHLEAFEFGFLWLFAFLKAETHQKMSFRALKNWINDSFRTSRPAKIDFT